MTPKKMNALKIDGKASHSVLTSTHLKVIRKDKSEEVKRLVKFVYIASRMT